MNILRTAPYKAMNFYMFDSARDAFLQRRPGATELTNGERASAGAAAGVVSALLFFPLDVVRRLTLSPLSAHRSPAAKHCHAACIFTSPSGTGREGSVCPSPWRWCMPVASELEGESGACLAGS